MSEPLKLRLGDYEHTIGQHSTVRVPLYSDGVEIGVLETWLVSGWPAPLPQPGTSAQLKTEDGSILRDRVISKANRGSDGILRLESRIPFPKGGSSTAPPRLQE